MKNQELWNSYVEKNNDPYGGACVKVAKRVMELLDADPTPLEEALRQPPVSGRVCFSSNCFFHDRTTDTCVGDYDKCTVKQTLPLTYI